MSDSSPGAELRDLKQNHLSAKAALRRLTQIGRVLTVVLCIVIIGSLGMLYNRVTTMYAPEQFEQPLREEAQNLLPRLEPQLRMLWEETAPVYGELALEKLEDALPLAQEASRVEFARLQEHVTSNARVQVNQALDRIARKHMQTLRGEFPRLSTEDGADELGMRWMEAVEGDFEQILLRFNDRYVEDLGELEATLERFMPNEFEQMPADQLIRNFAHLWLMKMDRLVLLQDDGRSYEERTR